MSIKSFLRRIYEKEYKKLLIIPMLILVISIVVIIGNYVTTGEFVKKGISLKGGVTVTVYTREKVDVTELQIYLAEEFKKADISTRILTRAGEKVGFVVDGTDIDADSLVTALKGKFKNLKEKDYTVEQMGSSLGESFFKEAMIAVAVAFLFMAFVVFYYFRIPVPSLAVILAAVSDMIVTLAVIDILNIKLSTAGLAAFLMLIGYSVDTDILLTARVMKRKEGSVFDALIRAMKTGLTMTAAALGATLAAFFFARSEVLKQIMLILIIGLSFDTISTWIQNAGILRWYLEKKHKDE